MRRILVLLLAGCEGLALPKPQSAADKLERHPLEVEYELLGTASAKVCAQAWELALGDVDLFARGRYLAIEGYAGADGLIEIRSSSERRGDGSICMIVNGRAYRLLSIRSTAGHSPGERSSAPSRSAEIPSTANPQERQKTAPKPQAEKQQDPFIDPGLKPR